MALRLVPMLPPLATAVVDHSPCICHIPNSTSRWVAWVLLLVSSKLELEVLVEVAHRVTVWLWQARHLLVQAC